MSLWSFTKVREALSDIENRSAYYAGGTLCIDFDYYPSVALNRNGRGFFYNFKNTTLKEIKFVMPDDIKQKVNELYKKYKAPEVV